MDNPSNEPADPDVAIDYTALKDCAATQRALDYYLKPIVSETPSGERFFAVSRHVGREEALIHASDLLRCAAAIAHETADSRHGAGRDLALSIGHMVDMAKAMVDRSLEADSHK
ncbi:MULTISPECIES: DUF6124 family protein [Pseudomonas]|jgi:hypothetical protein|uniref:DUF6124 family protein n=1 Tax=Pseudomonas TaxID=286 RepID=UPI0004800E35|nr:MULTISPECIES: DUF3077 domain-containing protein [Pseudomonas]PRA48325.1 DUF3077 domain-containing protein [Pseudomonas sp. MYb115]QXN52012.1 DUF3077 domain-containing protein [Pseudomonas fluorescens]WSO26340.1 DUF3077 domain-containing protein [Pseudomonas fluorescens]